MKNPEKPGDMICQNGVWRVNLDKWASQIPRDADNLIAFFRQTQETNKSLPNFLGYMVKLAGSIEPYDSAIGYDPVKQKTTSVSNGMYIGAIMLAPLISNDDSVILPALHYAKEVIEPNISHRPNESESRRDASFRAGQWLATTADVGRSLFEELDPHLDELTDLIQRDITHQLYVKIGAGVMMSTIWHGYCMAEKDKMQQFVDNTIQGSDLDAELTKLLG